MQDGPLRGHTSCFSPHGVSLQPICQTVSPCHVVRELQRYRTEVYAGKLGSVNNSQRRTVRSPGRRVAGLILYDAEVWEEACRVIYWR